MENLTKDAAEVLLKVIDNAKINSDSDECDEGYRDGIRDAMNAVLGKSRFVLTQQKNNIKLTVEEIL